MKNLKTLLLENCPITEIENYRNEIFALLPDLQLLDGKNRQGEDASDEDFEQQDELSENEQPKIYHHNEEEGPAENGQEEIKQNIAASTDTNVIDNDLFKEEIDGIIYKELRSGVLEHLGEEDVVPKCKLSDSYSLDVNVDPGSYIGNKRKLPNEDSDCEKQDKLFSEDEDPNKCIVIA